METLSRLLESTSEDEKYIKHLNKFLDTVAYRKDVYDDPRLYKLIFKELELYHESNREDVTNRCLIALRCSLTAHNQQLSQIYEAIPLDLISSISLLNTDVQESLITLICQLLTILPGSCLLDAPNEFFTCIIEISSSPSQGPFKAELIDKCQLTLFQLIECSSHARCRFGSVGVLTCLSSLYNKSLQNLSASQLARQLHDQVYSSIIKMFSDSNSRVRMTVVDSDIIDMVFNRLNQPMKSSQSKIIAESFAAFHHFENYSEGQLVLIQRGLLKVLLIYFYHFKENLSKLNKSSKDESSSISNSETKTICQQSPTNERISYFYPILLQMVNLFHMFSSNEKLRQHLCSSELLEYFLFILKQNQLHFSAQFSERLCNVLKNIFKCVSSLEALFCGDFLYEFINYATTTKGLDLSKLTKSSNHKRRRVSSTNHDSSKKVLISIVGTLTNENSRAILVNEINQLRKAQKSDETKQKCLLSLLYLVKYFTNLSDVKMLCHLTQSHSIAFSNLNHESSQIRHLSQASLYMLITNLYYEADIPLIKTSLINCHLPYFDESDDPRELFRIVLNQTTTVESCSSASSRSQHCAYKSMVKDYDWTLIIPSKSNPTDDTSSSRADDVSIPVSSRIIIGSSEYFNACLLGPFAKSDNSGSKSTTEFNLTKCSQAANCLVHLLHNCSRNCSVLQSELKRSVSVALELLELSCILLCSSIVKQRLYALLVSIYFNGDDKVSSHNVAHLLASAIKKYDESFLCLCLAHIFTANKRACGVYSYALCKVVLSDSFQYGRPLMGVDKMNELVKHLVIEKLAAVR